MTYSLLNFERLLVPLKFYVEMYNAICMPILQNIAPIANPLHQAQRAQRMEKRRLRRKRREVRPYDVELALQLHREKKVCLNTGLQLETVIIFPSWFLVQA